MMPPSDCPVPLAELFPEAVFAAKIGEGAYGEVWLARFPDGAWRAVKFVAGDGERAERERRALRLLRSLADPAAPDAPLHPALMPVADLREGPGAFAYSMPVADALRPNWRDDPAQYRPRTLAADLVARRALPLGECLDLAEALGGGLAYLQRHCLVHRDLKPSNVLYLEGNPVLADFGLLADTREAESVVGTPGYVPKEQHGDFPADIYSLGILLSVASTGRSANEVGLAPVQEADRLHPLFSRWLDLLRRATDASPARRPQTAEAFLQELHALRETPMGHRWGRQLLFAILILCAIGGGVVGLRHVLSSTSAPEPAPPVPESPDSQTLAVFEDMAEDGAILQPDGDHAHRPPASEPVPLSESRPLYVSRDMAEDGVFLQLYSDRIRVGLPMHGFAVEDVCLLLVLPPDDPAYDPDEVWDGPMPWRLCTLVPGDAENTPAGAAEDPVFPENAPQRGRSSHVGIAMLPDDGAYPEAVFLLSGPVWAWKERLEGHRVATFEELHALWWEGCERERSEREWELVEEANREFL